MVFIENLNYETFTENYDKIKELINKQFDEIENINKLCDKIIELKNKKDRENCEKHIEIFKNLIKEAINNKKQQIDNNRNFVINSYKAAECKNKEDYYNGDIKASEEYIYENQKNDSREIINMFYSNKDIRVISVIKRTKVGMDGLMIQLANDFSTHLDDNFLIMRKNIFFLTGMSNKSWENDMKDKIPHCFKENVYHHGQIDKITKQEELKNIKNALIIIDEIDTGDKIDQKLHQLLKKTKIFNIEYIKEKNIRFVFVSATMIYELKDLHKWGDHHQNYKMTIPANYIGHNDFLEKKIIDQFYPVKDKKSANRWIDDDILKKYKNDFRVHIIRTDNISVDCIKNACEEKNIKFYNHTSDERIDEKTLKKIFENINNHTVIAVKGFYRRANLIPNVWKKKIGATMERHVLKVDPNVQVQGLPGRMTGYWKSDIDKGHITGPHRTSIKAIEDYEKFYENPDADNNKKIKKNLLTNPNLVGIKIKETDKNWSSMFFDNWDNFKDYCKKNKLNYNPQKKEPNKDGFIEATVRGVTKVYSTDDFKNDHGGGINDNYLYRLYHCYSNIKDKNTLKLFFVFQKVEENKIFEEEIVEHKKITHTNCLIDEDNYTIEGYDSGKIFEKNNNFIIKDNIKDKIIVKKKEKTIDELEAELSNTVLI
jgi:hypothetical protein